MVLMVEILASPETCAEAVTIIRALETPDMRAQLEQDFEKGAVADTYDSAHLWYRTRMSEGLPTLRLEPALASVGASTLPGRPLDATMHEGAEEFKAFEAEFDPVAFTGEQSRVVLSALRRVVSPDGRRLSYDYESHRTADYLAEHSPSVHERELMSSLVLPAIARAVQGRALLQ